MRIDAMAFLDGLVGELRGVPGQIDFDDVAELFLPVGSERRLILEARRGRTGWPLRRCGRRERSRCGQRAGGSGGRRDKITPVDLVLIAHRENSMIAVGVLYGMK